MKKIYLITVLIIGVVLTGTVIADVQSDGLYHNSTSQYPSATDEILPATLVSGETNYFLEVDYIQTNASVYFLTGSPAGAPGETVETYVRFYSTKADWNAASVVTTAVLDASGNQFHDTPVAGTDTLDVWKATWTPPRGFTGSVYYAIQVKSTDTNTSISDVQYLVSAVNTNNGWSGGLNDTYWQTNAQYVAETWYMEPDFTGVDYTFLWTNELPLNYDYFYFNNTNAPLPEAEDVPGLPGRKFFEFSSGPDQPGYVHILAPPGGLNEMNVRIWFSKQGGGGAERFVSGGWLTNVVLATNSFHNTPSAVMVTVEVWQAQFYPPTGTEAMYYIPQVVTPEDGTQYLVEGYGSHTNNWITNPQMLDSVYSPDRDYEYTPVQVFSNSAALNTDWAYMNHTNSDPSVEQIPGNVIVGSFSGGPFLDVSYATTTTTFYVMTDKPLNLIPGEWPRIQARISYDATGAYQTVWADGTWVANLEIEDTTPFHGLPTSGSHTVDLWKVEWPQPVDELGDPRTNAFNVYFSFLLNTYASSAQAWETGFQFLTSQGSITNNYTTDPQYFDSSPVGKDFAYPHQWVLILPVPNIQAMALVSGGITATLESSVNTRLYVLQYTTNLTTTPSPLWVSADTQAGTSGTLELSDTNLVDSSRAYRVLEQTP